MTYYFIKQLVGALAMPLVLALSIAIAAAVVRSYGRRRTMKWLLVCAAGIAYFRAITPVGDALLWPLEREHPPLRQNEGLPAIRYVVVLGSGYSPRDGIPVTAALDEEGLVRVVEGVRLVRSLGAVRLVVSGGAFPGKTSSVLGYAELARALGVDAASLIVLDHSLDTGAEARAVAALTGTSPFVLVTSAYHMPRSIRLMERAGAHPIPAPTGQLVDRLLDVGLRAWLPSSRGLRKTERALHEYLGLVALAAGFA